MQNKHDSLLTDTALQQLSQQIHVQMLRIPFRGDMATTVRAARLAKKLGMVPLLILPYKKQSTALRLIKAMNTIFGKNTVYYEYSNERNLQGVTSADYTAAWNADIPVLKQRAPNGKFIGPVMHHADSAYLADFVAHANPRPDGVSWHEYTCDSTDSDETCIGNIEKRTTHIAEARDAIRNVINTELPIWITEYNYSALNTPDTRIQDKVFITAWTAKAIETLIQNKVFGAAQYVLNENSALAMISSTHTLTGQAQAFQATFEQYASRCVTTTPLPTASITPKATQTQDSTVTPIITATSTLTSDVTPTLVPETTLSTDEQAFLTTNISLMPVLNVAPSEQLLSFLMAEGNTASRPVIVSNTGDQALTWEATAEALDKSAWLSIDDKGSTLAPGAKATIHVKIDARRKVAGTYIGQLIIHSNGGNQTVFIRLIILPKSTPIKTPTSESTDKASPTPKSTRTPVASPTQAVFPCSPPTSSEATGTPTIKPSIEGKCSKESPYGITTIHGDKELVDRERELGICWVRFQMDGKSLLSAPGTFNWSKLDGVVATLNAAGIYILFPMRCIVQRGGGCFSSPALPTPQEMADFATAVASRYDGKHGHGRIDAFQCGNEEFDFHPPEAYGLIVEECSRAIKAVYPEAKVVSYGTFKPNLTHTKQVMSVIARHSQYLDAIAFHYYVKGTDPRGGSGYPSFIEEIEAIQAIIPDKPIWVTEIGWPTRPVGCCKPVSPEIQAQYLHYIMETASRSKVVEKVVTKQYSDLNKRRASHSLLVKPLESGQRGLAATLA